MLAHTGSRINKTTYTILPQLSGLYYNSQQPCCTSEGSNVPAWKPSFKTIVAPALSSKSPTSSAKCLKNRFRVTEPRTGQRRSSLCHLTLQKYNYLERSLLQRRNRTKSLVKGKSTSSQHNSNYNNISQLRTEFSTNRFRIQEVVYQSNLRKDQSSKSRQDTSYHSTIQHVRRDPARNSEIEHASSYNNTITPQNPSTTIVLHPRDKKVRQNSRRQQGSATQHVQIPAKSAMSELYSKLREHVKNNIDESGRGKQSSQSRETNGSNNNRFRRGKYVESAMEQRQSTKPQLNLRKLGYTVNSHPDKTTDLSLSNNINRGSLNAPNTKAGPNTDKAQVNNRNNFRRNKYEVQSQVIKKDRDDVSQENTAPENMKYSSMDIQKKESNTSLIRELDRQAREDLINQEKLIIHQVAKHLEKSIEKSAEEYFRDNLRAKSKNQIEGNDLVEIKIKITVKNPLIRCSQASTNNQEQFVSTMDQKSQEALYVYDFELNESEPKQNTNRHYEFYKSANNIECGGPGGSQSCEEVGHQNVSSLESSGLIEVEDNFIRERREAQRRFIVHNKQLGPRLLEDLEGEERNMGNESSDDIQEQTIKRHFRELQELE